MPNDLDPEHRLTLVGNDVRCDRSP